MREGSVPTGCPCGRCATIRRARPFSLRKPKPHAELVEVVSDALLAGKAGKLDENEWLVWFAGDCQNPLRVSAWSDASRAVFARYEVRCRKCNACLRARTNYWGFAAMEQTALATAQGRRTWFGTLTLSPDSQAAMRQRAIERYAARPDGSNPNWENPVCETAFALIRAEVIREVQKYWKRLRKAGHRFKYFLVVERHKSGLPHLHFLLHEEDKPITKRALQAQWPFGHSNVSIVGGKSAHAAAPEKAAWYVVKYLSKSAQSRQIASTGYRPRKGMRSNTPHSAT